MSQASGLDTKFIEKQRGKLTELRNEIISAKKSAETERSAVASESGGQAREYEEDAQRLASEELSNNLASNDAQRLADIDRALQKIEDGTYGLSDKSGAPIPKDRLEALPEALHTIEEQRASQAK